MPDEVGATIRFEKHASTPLDAVALIYDLEGFSHFFSQPDVQTYVPLFLNHVSAALNAVFFGGYTFWTGRNVEDDHTEPLSTLPVHEKFLGDGALYIWKTPDPELAEDFLVCLCNRLWNLKQSFARIAEAAADDVPVVEVPRRIRFGLARGTAYELRTAGGGSEYIGYCINLASRLQNYCGDLGFIASARIGLPKDVIARDNYMRVVAKKLRGFPREIVIVDKREFESLQPQVRKELFDSLA